MTEKTSSTFITILLVEDHPAMIQHFEKALTDPSIAFLSATTTQHAKNILADQPVDLAILDNNLKDGAGGGPEIAEFIVQTLWGKTTPNRPLFVEASALLNANAPGVTESYCKEKLVTVIRDKKPLVWAREILQKGPGYIAPKRPVQSTGFSFNCRHISDSILNV